MKKRTVSMFRGRLNLLKSKKIFAAMIFFVLLFVIVPAYSATPPGAPTNLKATAGSQSATVSFSPPTSNGGSPITSYTVTSYPGNITASGTASPITVTGLTNGTAYQFVVKATNAVGTSTSSTASNSVTPAAPPGRPTNVTATAGNGQATVSFSPPTYNGGRAITGYTVTIPSSSSIVPLSASGTASPITVTGLTNGMAYRFIVKAHNAVGTGPESELSNLVMPAAPPGAPTNVRASVGDGIVTVLVGDGRVAVSFTAPLSTGGSAITGYTVTSNAGHTATGTTSPILISGLTNGTAYTFTVKAKNAVGTSAASTASNSVTPIGPPGAPTNVKATAGSQSATVSFSPPASNGGSTITGYTVTSSAGHTATGTTSPITVSGLTNGTAYTFTVKAKNVGGISTASTASNSVTPWNVPGAPTNVTATAYTGRTSVSFTAPSSTGGSAITGFTVTSSAGHAATGTTSPITVTGLTNGTVYTFTVKATNAIGTGTSSAPSNSVTPLGPPGAPTDVSATAVNPHQKATVTFTAPTDNGGSVITGYTVTSSTGHLATGGHTATGTASPITVAGLTNGTKYTFTVKATNAIGTGPAAYSNSVTPIGPPEAPTNVTATAGNGQATVSFTAPTNNGGSPITFYLVTSGAGHTTGTASPITVTGLKNGIAYTFTVKATNAVGTGPESALSNSVTPQATVPGAPTNVTATAGNGQAIVSFTTPTDNGGSAIIGYTVTSSAGHTVTSTASPITFKGLTNGWAYTFTVKATNAAGTGPASAPSASLTPTAQ